MATKEQREEKDQDPAAVEQTEANTAERTASEVPTPDPPALEERPKRLYLTDDAVEAGSNFARLGVPFRDLGPDDLAALPDETVAEIMSPPPGVPAIYQKTKPKGRTES
jgi:hypothetical protein